jgi:hypothetical protein
LFLVSNLFQQEKCERTNTDLSCTNADNQSRAKKNVKED